MTPNTETAPESESEKQEAANRSLGRRVTHEIILVAAFYGLYTLTRDLNGSAHVSDARALHNAQHVIRIERFLHIFHEQTIQHWFIHDRWLLWFCDVFYGSAHFIVTIGILIWTFIAFPKRYRFWRNALAITTGIALIGFITYPLMPPRLLPMFGLHYTFVDTLDKIGGLWSFDSIKNVSNQYAAMPSLHIGWSMWCATALVNLAQKKWVKIVAVLYPVFVLFCIVVTANHYFLDAIGGATIFSIGLFVASVIEKSRKTLDAPPTDQQSAQPESSAQPQNAD